MEKDGHDVTFTDAPARGYDLNHILNIGKELKPGLIVMDTSTPSIENDISVCDKIKEIVPQAYTVMVGTHVSALPEEA
ncbi:MAG: B12-binding domain-containing radical SAM protein, partial [Geobacter sp.]